MKNGWPTATLGEICGFQNGFAFKSKSFKPTGCPILRISNIQDDCVDIEKLVFFDPKDYREDLDRYRIVEGDLLIAMSGATTGKLGFNTESTVFYLNQRVGQFEPGKQLDKRFLYYFLSTQVEENLRISAGAAQPNLSTEQIKGFALPVPPLPEQRRIVGILDEAFDGIATAKSNAEQNLQNARALFESHLNAVFSQRSDGWVANDEPLANFCELIVDCEHKTAPTQGSGIPSIRTPNIGKGRLLLDGVYRVSEETYKAWTRRAEPRAGDLILAREAPAGNVGVIPKNARVCLGQRTVLIRPKATTFDPLFLAYQLLSAQMQIRLLGHSRGATVQHVNMKDIRALHLESFPSLSTQKQLVTTINALVDQGDDLISIYQRKLAAIDELKKSLLHQAFSGKL